MARDAAMMLFYVIAPSNGLSGEDLEKACEIGPPFVDVPSDYAELLMKSGWGLLERTDLTNEYLHALRRLANGLEAKSEILEKVLGIQEFNRQLGHRRDQVAAIEDGLLEREVFLVQVV